MKNLIIVFSLLLVLSSGLISCSKDAGEVGPKGEQGVQGQQGIPGKDGAVIHKGNVAPASSLGNVGDMYLNVSNSMLYGPKITNNDWGAPLNLRGLQGVPGAAGAAGATGPTGATGPAGTAGKSGADGADGSKILSGTTNPVVRTGELGDYYLNKNTGDFFGPKTATGWGSAINLKGTANVVASPKLNINWRTSYKDYFYTYDIPTPYLNAIGETSLESMLGKGGIMICYIISDVFNSPMPLILSVGSKPGQYYWLASAYNRIQLNFCRMDGSSIIGEASFIMPQFRFVLIPASKQLTASTGKVIAKDELKKMSFQQMHELLEYNNLSISMDILK